MLFFNQFCWTSQRLPHPCSVDWCMYFQHQLYTWWQRFFWTSCDANNRPSLFSFCFWFCKTKLNQQSTHSTRLLFKTQSLLLFNSSLSNCNVVGVSQPNERGLFPLLEKMFCTTTSYIQVYYFLKPTTNNLLRQYSCRGSRSCPNKPYKKSGNPRVYHTLTRVCFFIFGKYSIFNFLLSIRTLRLILVKQFSYNNSSLCNAEHFFVHTLLCVLIVCCCFLILVMV